MKTGSSVNCESSYLGCAQIASVCMYHQEILLSLGNVIVYNNEMMNVNKKIAIYGTKYKKQVYRRAKCNHIITAHSREDCPNALCCDLYVLWNRAIFYE